MTTANPAAINLRNDVKAAVEAQDTNGGENNVRSLVVDRLRQAEITRRTDLLADALTKREAIDKDLRKIKPSRLASVDQETGKESFEYTKGEIENRKKLTSKLEKLDVAINAVIETPSGETYGKLKEVAAKS